MENSPSDPNLTPALKAPDGTVSNLVDPPSEAYITIVVLSIFLIVTTPLVLIRLYTRHFITRHLWWDDYAAIVGWIGLVGVTAILVKSIDYGNGKDSWNVSKTQMTHFTELFSDFEIVGRLSIFFTKLSILLMYLRLFVPRQSKKTRTFLATWAVIWFNGIFCLASILVVIFQCVGKHKPAGSTCIDTYAHFIAASTINVVSDIVMLVIPLVVIWRLQLPTKQKMGSFLVFAVGVLAVASSIARLAWQLYKARDPNRTALLTKVALLAVAEHTIGLIVGCMTALPAFIYHFSRQQITTASKPHTDTWRSGLGAKNYGCRGTERRNDPNESYLLSADYRELNDLEHLAAPDSKGTTTMIDGGCSDISMPEQAIEGLHGNPATNALVSNSVHVESFPRSEVENGHQVPVPQEAHFKT